MTNCPQALGEDALFQIVRSGPDAQITIRRQNTSLPVDQWVILEQRFEPLASSTGLLIEGDEHIDIVTLDNSGGPIRLPLRFDAGEETDELQLLGQAHVLDLVARDQITGVEKIDIRGRAAIRLCSTRTSCEATMGTGNSLIVQADADDRVVIGPAWNLSRGAEQIDGASYQVFVEWNATLKISAEAIPDHNGAGGTPSPTGSPWATPSTQAGTGTPSGHGRSRCPTTRPIPTDRPMRWNFVDDRSSPTDAEVEVDPNESFLVDIVYDTEPLVGTTGLHLRIHYDSSLVQFEEFFGRWPDGFSVEETATDGPCLGSEGESCYGFDGDPQTDTYVQLLWIDPQGQWPARGPEPLSLLQSQFFALPNFRGETTVRLTGSLAADFELETMPIIVRQRAQPGDFDSSGVVDAGRHHTILSAAQLDDAGPRFRSDRRWGCRLGRSRSIDLRHPGNNVRRCRSEPGLSNPRILFSYSRRGIRRSIIQGNSTWSTGDWNCDGEFDSSDFVLAFQTGDYEVAAAAPRPVIALTAESAVAAAQLAGSRIRRRFVCGRLCVAQDDSAATDASDRQQARSREWLFALASDERKEWIQDRFDALDETVAKEFFEALALDGTDDLANQNE